MNAVCCAINPKLYLAAVGTSNGEVLIYKISSDLKELQLRQKITSHSECIKSMAFSNDGMMLCIGYSKGGIGVFHSLSGVCIMSTFKKLSQNEILQNEIATLAWGSEGYRLLCASQQSSTFYVFSFAKPITLRNPPQNKQPCVVLQSSDRILLFHMASYSDLNSAFWEHLQVVMIFIILILN